MDPERRANSIQLREPLEAAHRLLNEKLLTRIEAVQSLVDYPTGSVTSKIESVDGGRRSWCSLPAFLRCADNDIRMLLRADNDARRRMPAGHLRPRVV
jgi:hypothetical protein